MWMSLNEVVNDNGMQWVGRETNIAQGQYCNIALGQYWFPFALDCDLNEIQHCSWAILEYCPRAAGQYEVLSPWLEEVT